MLDTYGLKIFQYTHIMEHNGIPTSNQAIKVGFINKASAVNSPTPMYMLRRAPKCFIQ